MPARRRRSTSTAWCATITCAKRPSWASCSSIWRRRTSASAPATRSRSTCARGSKALTLPPGTVVKVVEVPPGPPVLATLLAEIYGPDSTTRRAVAAEVQEDLRVRPYHRRHRRHLSASRGRGCASRSTRTARILRRRAARRLRHDPGAVRRQRRSAIPSRRGPQADRDRRAAAQARSVLERAAGLDAGARQQRARQQDGRRTRRRRAASPKEPARPRSSATTAASPTW